MFEIAFQDLVHEFKIPHQKMQAINVTVITVIETSNQSIQDGCTVYVLCIVWMYAYATYVTLLIVCRCGLK